MPCFRACQDPKYSRLAHMRTVYRRTVYNIIFRLDTKPPILLGKELLRHIPTQNTVPVVRR